MGFSFDCLLQGLLQDHPHLTAVIRVLNFALPTEVAMATDLLNNFQAPKNQVEQAFLEGMGSAAPVQPAIHWLISHYQLAKPGNPAYGLLLLRLPEGVSHSVCCNVPLTLLYHDEGTRCRGRRNATHLTVQDVFTSQQP